MSAEADEQNSQPNQSQHSQDQQQGLPSKSQHQDTLPQEQQDQIDFQDPPPQQEDTPKLEPHSTPPKKPASDPPKKFPHQSNQKTTERSFKTLEQIYSKKRIPSSMQFLRTPDQFDRRVIHDQINTSHAKQQYSFAKAQRFSRPRESYCATQFYDCQVRSALGTRSAALGFGIKSDFTKCDKYIPGPTAYKIDIKNLKGVKFAYGRDETAKMGILGNMTKNPAPNVYNIKDIKTDIKYSLGERTKAKHIYIESKTPAPGTYNVGGFSKDGSYFYGRFKSSGAPLISPPSQHSVRYKRIPGPGTYDPPGDIGDTRSYLPSNYSTKSGFRFGISERQTQQIKNKFFPGPGSYQLPSEFGDFEYPPMV